MTTTMHDPVLLTAVWGTARLACWGMMLYAERARTRRLARLARAAGPGSTVAWRDRDGWLVIVRGEGR
jgi:hypothetical protein